MDVERNVGSTAGQAGTEADGRSAGSGARSGGEAEGTSGGEAGAPSGGRSDRSGARSGGEAGGQAGAQAGGQAGGPSGGEPMASDDYDLDYRFTLANERTFLAWLRTALGLLAGAVALVHLVPPGGEDADKAERGIGFALALLGIAVVLASVRRWQRVQQAMQRHENLPVSRAPIYLGAAVVGIGAAVIVLLAR